MEPYRRPNFSSIGNMALGNNVPEAYYRGAPADLERESLARSQYSLDSRRSGESRGRFARAAENSLGMNATGSSRRAQKPVPADDSSSEEEGKDGNLLQMMMMSMMMNKDAGGEDENVVKLVKELQKENDQIVKLRQNFAKNGTPYANQMADKIQALERMVLEADKKSKAQNSGYFFNQMLMMMMMNPNFLNNPSMLLMLQMMMGGQSAAMDDELEPDDEEDDAEAEIEQQFGGMFNFKQKQKEKKSGKDGGKEGKDKKEKKKKKKSKWKDKEVPIVIEEKKIELDGPDIIKLTNEQLQAELRKRELEVEEKMRGMLKQAQQSADSERLEKENKERELQRRVELLVRKFKGYVWRLALPGLFLRGLEGEALERRSRLIKSYADSFPSMLESLKNTCRNICVKGATELWSLEESVHCLQSNNLVIQYAGEKPANAGKDLDSRCESLERVLKKFMEALVEETKENIFSPSVLNFLGAYTENGSYLFEKFHFEYEISRLEFNSWGAIKNISRGQRRLLLCNLVVFHTLFPFFFSKPWEVDSVAYKRTETRMLNVRVAGSILYHYFMDTFKQVDRIKANQAFLPPNLQNKARKENYKLDNRPKIQPRPLEPGKEPELYDDVFTKSELKAIFAERKNQFEFVKEQVELFVDRLEDIVKATFKSKKDDQRKEARREYKARIKKVIKSLKRARLYTAEEEARDYGGEYKEADDGESSRGDRSTVK